MDIAEMRRLVARAPVARLATVRRDGRPHLVPMCFAVEADTIVSVVDDKPKRSRRLRRLDNVRARPAVSLLVDHYDDVWSRLWWVRVDGTARIVEGGDEHTRALDRLAAKYAQYREERPTGAVVAIVALEWHGWSAS